jgi:hypothetical protein
MSSIRDDEGRLVGRPEIDAIWQGRRTRAVGNRLHFRPPNETKHEFYVVVLVQALGERWGGQQRALEPGKRHVIAQWLGALSDVQKGTSAIDKRQEVEGIYTATATGDLWPLICLAYDVYTLLHNGHVSDTDPIFKRLGHPDQFQGARYELAVAAVFARAGFTIAWITETDRRLPEFIALNPASGTEIAVEAKSRHRPGVLGRTGEAPAVDAVKVDVRNLMDAALEKEIDGRPFVVCIDLNLPETGERSVQDWMRELHDAALEHLGPASEENPDPFSAVFFTNYSWHWAGDKAAGQASSFVVVPNHTASPLSDDERALLTEALFQYGNVPGGR